MDHIAKALERARGDNPTLRDWVKPAVAPQEKLEPLAEYHQVSLSPEVLRSNLILAGHGHEDEVLADVYRQLRTQVLHRLASHGWRAIGVTSPEPGSGKTLTAINLAISLARHGAYRVVLIDADLRRPTVASKLGVEPAKGFIDYLRHGCLDRVVMDVGVENLYVLAGKGVGKEEETPDLLHSDNMHALLDRVCDPSAMNVVIMDLPPVMIGDDVLAAAALLDSLLLVVEDGRTETSALEKAVELLQPFDLLGTVLNRSDEQRTLGDGYYSYSSGRGNA